MTFTEKQNDSVAARFGFGRGRGLVPPMASERGEARE